MNISGLRRSSAVDTVRRNHPGLSWAATHAAAQAVAGRLSVITVNLVRYRGVPVDVVSL